MASDSLPSPSHEVAFQLPPIPEKRSEEKYGAPISSMESYHRHNEYLRRMVPKDRLIELEPSQAWESLWEFIGTPVPARDFPRLNVTKQTQRRFC
jgi:hypothetical protein